MVVKKIKLFTSCANLQSDVIDQYVKVVRRQLVRLKKQKSISEWFEVNLIQLIDKYMVR